MRIQIICFFVLCLVFLSCKDDKQKVINGNTKTDYVSVKLNSNRPNLNISILLDLSDRISPTKYPNPSMEFYLRDVGYIKSIAESFEIHLRNKKSIKIKDKLQLFLDPEPSDKNLNEKINNLKMSFTKDNAKKELILQTSKKYDSVSRLIYESAIKDNKYVGSDIWKFTKNKVKDYCIEKEHRNILIVLTDGYIYHESTRIREGNLTTYITPQTIRANNLNNSNWKTRMDDKNFGFIPATSDLSDLEILVLGINPNKSNPYEEDVIKAYWEKWFVEMKVKRYEIKNADLPSNMEKVIRNFILEN